MISDSDKSTIILDDFIFDSSNVRRYRMICKTCNKDRGYQRSNTRKKECMSCGQKGKISGRKGKKLTEKQKENISNTNTIWRTEQDPNYIKLTEDDKRMIHNIRCRLWQVINSKPGSMSKALGCKTHELRIHLESLFEPWMNWDNYGPEWEIDHITPLSSFNLNNIEEFNKACHHTNLQPLSVFKNRSKGAKLEDI